MNKCSSLLKRAYENSSAIVWVVNINHLLWGWFFLTQELPRPFGAIHAFEAPELQATWGIVFLVVSISSMFSDLLTGMWGTVLLIPQQLIVTYAAMEMLNTMLDASTPRLLLAFCWVAPLTFFHSTAIVTRIKREHENQR